MVAKSYYSTVFEQTAGQVWAAIRDIGDYQWAGVDDTQLDEGKSGDAVGGIRRFSYGGETIRQRLLAHSDLDRTYTFASCDPIPFPRATPRPRSA